MKFKWSISGAEQAKKTGEQERSDERALQITV